MNEKVSLLLKVTPTTRVLIAECARLEHRTISAYVEAFVEKDAKSKKIDDQVEVKAKKTKVKSKAIDIDTGQVLTHDSWLAWLEHMRKMGAPLNYGQAELHFKEFCRHDAEGYDCNVLVKEITERYPWKFPYIPNEWKRSH